MKTLNSIFNKHQIIADEFEQDQTQKRIAIMADHNAKMASIRNHGNLELF